MSVPAPVVAYEVSRLVDGIVDKLLFALRSWFFDSAYVPVTTDAFNDVLERWRRNILPRLRYRYEIFDCDDFARYFASWAGLKTGTNAFGIAIGIVETPSGSYGHAWNVVLVGSSGGQILVTMVEPQLGAVIPVATKVLDVREPIVVRRRRSIGNATVRYRLKAVVW